ncbi:MAG: histidine kinase [Rudaea sp.]
MARGWLWLQLALAWLPMWALFTALIVIAHGSPLGSAAIASARMIAPGAVLGYFVYQFTLRVPWPHPFRLAFIGMHCFAAAVYSVIWFALMGAIDSLVVGHLVLAIGPGIGAFLITGVWLYIMVAGVAYTNRAAQRTAQLESYAARMQLAELRAQLHPHFLFNAMHTIVQLIPTDPRTAVQASEQLAGILRGVLEDNEDLIPLARELDFVERVLAIERIRFGARLAVHIDASPSLAEYLIPSFSLQTLVENAVRHGAAPRVETTHLSISAHVVKDILTLQVADDGAGAVASGIEQGNGTGLRRLHERLRWLYGNMAQLDIETGPSRGFTATLRLPLLNEHPND